MSLFSKIKGRISKPKASALFGSAYTAASHNHPATEFWDASGYSGQSAVEHSRGAITNRAHSLIRNDPIAAAAVNRVVEMAIGRGLVFMSDPDFESLNIDPESDVAYELQDKIEREYDLFANNSRFLADVERHSTLDDLDALAARGLAGAEGEACGVVNSLDRGGVYNTCVQVIDAARLSSPVGKTSSPYFRDGIELNAHGAAVAYHVRQSHPNDNSFNADSFKWVRVKRETRTGRPVFIHAFKKLRPGQLRGISPFAPVLTKLKQLDRYNDAELSAALQLADMPIFIKSDMPPELLESGLDFGVGEKAVGKEKPSFLGFEKYRGKYHKAQNLARKLGAKIGILSAGEDVTTVAPTYPALGTSELRRGHTQATAAALGVGYSQISGDLTKVNYSSERSGKITVKGATEMFVATFVSQWKMQILRAFMEEAFAKGRIKLPKGAVPFSENPDAWMKSIWIAPGPGWIDPKKEADAVALRLQNNITSYADEVASTGKHPRRMLKQIKRWEKVSKKMGVNLNAQSSSDQKYSSDEETENA